jgi:hypothetical protein
MKSVKLRNQNRFRQGVAGADRSSLVPQQGTLRRARGLRQAPESRPRRARSPGGGVLRSALPAGAGSAGDADRGAEPRHLRSRADPGAAAAARLEPARLAGMGDEPDRLLPRAAGLQHPGRRGPARPPGRFRRRARQPVPRIRAARYPPPGPAAGGHHPPPDQPRPQGGAGRGPRPAQALGRPLVRVRAHAGARRPPAPGAGRRLRRRHRRRGFRSVSTRTRSVPAANGYPAESSPSPAPTTR